MKQQWNMINLYLKKELEKKEIFAFNRKGNQKFHKIAQTSHKISIFDNLRILSNFRRHSNFGNEIDLKMNV